MRINSNIKYGVWKKMVLYGITLDYVAVLGAGIASMIAGFIWYGPLFGKLWMKEMKIDSKNMEGMKKGMSTKYALSLAGSLVMAVILGHVLPLMQAITLVAGLTAGFWMWLGFIAPVQFTEVLFGGKSMKLFALNTGHQLVSVLVMSAVLVLV
ncbi:MAG: DUF1761 domain-containing protein [Candidatus Diapherotrites archaeon]|nr:DUF1761 domain-containing protein [Candidatus Diapherotrites archaeon]